MPNTHELHPRRNRKPYWPSLRFHIQRSACSKFHLFIFASPCWHIRLCSRPFKKQPRSSFRTSSSSSHTHDPCLPYHYSFRERISKSFNEDSEKSFCQSWTSK